MPRTSAAAFDFPLTASRDRPQRVRDPTMGVELSASGSRRPIPEFRLLEMPSGLRSFAKRGIGHDSLSIPIANI